MKFKSSSLVFSQVRDVAHGHIVYHKQLLKTAGIQKKNFNNFEIFYDFLI